MQLAEVLQALASDATEGLSEEEAQARLAKYGPNRLVLEKEVSSLKIFFKQFKNLLLAILLVATGISVVLGEVLDALVIFVIVVFVVILGFAQEYRAERTLEALKRLLSPVCAVVRDGRQRQLPVEHVVPGDLLALVAGDKVPADARLADSVNLQVDEAPLTGESLPVRKGVERLAAETPLAEQSNMVFSGTTVTYGKGKAVVTGTGMETEFGHIARAATVVVTEITPLERRMSEIGRQLGLIALVVIAVIATVAIAEEVLRTGALGFAAIISVVLFGIALAVAAVPEALPAIVTGSLAIGMRIMARRNALVRRMPAVETLGSTQIICSDKTGTLTKGEMTVREVYAGAQTYSVGGVGYEPKGTVSWAGLPLGPDGQRALSRLASAASLCNDATVEEDKGRWAVRGDPTEGALLVLAGKLGVSVPELRASSPRIGEVPFSSERKRMTTVHTRVGGSVIAFMKGAPEIVLLRCGQIVEDGVTRSLRAEDRAQILAAAEQFAKGARRTLAVAERALPNTMATFDEAIETDFVFLGLVGMIDPPRPEAVEAVAASRRVGMRPVMITGDHKLTALAIGREMGIYREGDLVLAGEELERLSDGDFLDVVEKVTVYARVLPLHKLRIVEAWKKKGYVVAMTGDGVNDAPALKRSDIGIAMGVTGTDVTKEAADLVLADDNFATIVKAIELGRWIYDNVKKYLAYLLQANLVEIAVMTLGVLLIARLFGIQGESALPLLPVHILYINLATDGLPALALGFSPPDPDLMQRPPRPKNEPVFTRDVQLFLLRALLVGTPVLTLAFVSALPMGVEAARSRLFLMFVFTELALALNCRSLAFTVNRAKPHKWLVLAVVWETVLVAILLFIPGARAALHLLVPTIEDLLWVAGGTAITFGSVEGLKVLMRPAAVDAPR
jgi:Ca2+-transporting ATPase